MKALFLSFTSLVCAMEHTNEHQNQIVLYNPQLPHVVAYQAQQARTKWFNNVYAYAAEEIIQKNPDWVGELMDDLHAMTAAERAQIANLCHENRELINSTAREYSKQSRPCSLLSIPIFSEPDPLRAWEWLQDMNVEKSEGNSGKFELGWRRLTRGAREQGENLEILSRIIYGNQGKARVAFIKDFPNIVQRAKKRGEVLGGKTFSNGLADPFDHATVWKILEKSDQLRESLYSFYKEEGDSFYALFKTMQEALVADCADCAHMANDLDLQRLCDVDVQFLQSIWGIEMLYHLEDQDLEALTNMITLGKMISDALLYPREDFKTGKIEKHKETQEKLLRWMEEQVAASGNLETVEHFCEQILDNNGKIFENKKFSKKAQYAFLLRSKERNEQIPKTLFKHFDKDLIKDNTIRREQLKALLFMEKAFPALRQAEQPNDLKEEKIKEEIVPYQEQNNILELIEKDHSFPAIKKEFRRMILDANRETLLALAATGYKPLKHLVNNLFDKDKGLSEEEWAEVSPDIVEMLGNLHATLNTEETPAQKKKNKNKTEEDKFSSAKNKIFDAKSLKASHGLAPLPESYEKSEGLIALKEKNIKWENLQKEIKNLGGEAYQDGHHYKITFYLGGSTEEPKVVTKKDYQEITGKESFKHQMTKTTHVPHGKKEALDLQFQEDVMEMVEGLFEKLI